MGEAELMAHDRWSRDDLVAFQREHVRALVTHAVSHSPYYREALRAEAADRLLAELPTLPKSTMMAEFDRVVTDPRLRLADLQEHLGSANPLESFLGRFESRRRLVRPVDDPLSPSLLTRLALGGRPAPAR